MEFDTGDLEHRGRRGYAEDVLSGLSARIIGCAMKVHSDLGPGLLESAYEACLCREMTLEGLPIARQLPVPVNYRGVRITCGYRLDLMVADQVIVEVKAMDALLPIHRAQLLTYLRLSRRRLGLLLNFNVCHLRHGIIRVVC